MPAVNIDIVTGTLTVGTTAISGGASGRVLYDNAGTLGELPLGTGVSTALAVNVGSTGAFVVFDGALGTPSSGTLSNATGLPISTGVSGLGTGIATWLATPSSANLASAITDETGSGALVFGTGPTFPTSITVGAASGATGTVLLKGTTSGTVTLSTADAAGTWTMKLPTTGGTSGYFLQTDGSGNTTWAAAGGGLTVGTTTITSGTSGRILYDNAGVLGEAAVTGTLGSVVLSTAPTLTGPVTLNEVAGSSGLTITGATQTTSQPALNVTQTWNSGAVNFIGQNFNFTATAEAGSSMMARYQIGGSDRLRFDSNGRIRLYDQANTNARIISENVTNTGIYVRSGTFGMTAGGTSILEWVGSTEIRHASTCGIAWASGAANSTSSDTFLYRDAANTLAQKNSTKAQEFRVYGTTTGSKYSLLKHDGTDGTLDVSSGKLILGGTASDIQWNKALVALGGGAAPTLGTIGGSGPATAAQNSWMQVKDSTGATFWVPAWK